MPIPATKRTLPDPTWTQSDNDLLPKWMKYLEWHSQHEGDGEISRLQGMIRNDQHRIESATRYIKEYNNQIKRFKDQLAELTNAPVISDDELRSKHDELIALPYVAGTRVGRAGELHVLIDTAKLCPEGHSLGWVEVGYEFSLNGRIHFVSGNIDEVYRALAGYYRADFSTIGGVTTLSVSLNTPRRHREYVTSGDIAKVVSYMAEQLERYALDYIGRIAQVPADKHAAYQPWSGYVTDPALAIRRLQEVTEAPTAEREVRNLESNIVRYTEAKKEYSDELRKYRNQLREHQAELLELEKARANAAGTTIDIEEARTTLEYISTLPGVIAIKFDGDGIPVLHLRNSVVHDGKRYDLGDFELYLRTEDAYFGTTMKVRRTRCPAGGSYDQGWHPEADRFCFGRTSIVEILDAYRRGDFGHCVNIAIGIMNSLSAGHEYLIEAGQFAEIAIDNVWQRKLPTRPRRRRATQVALGAAALKTA